jgi:NAD-dependent DNA ligase
VEDERFYNRVSGDRLASRQIDELIGLARGLCADGVINQAEVEFLEKWLAANIHLTGQPLVRVLYDRVRSILADGKVSSDEHKDLWDCLDSLGTCDFELGEVLKSSSLPLCDPAPDLEFAGKRYTFTGTFEFGQRKFCEREVALRGAEAGSLTRQTNFLVIGAYATESWKHSSMGNKILQACEMREEGLPIAIVAEEHWVKFL